MPNHSYNGQVGLAPYFPRALSSAPVNPKLEIAISALERINCLPDRFTRHQIVAAIWAGVDALCYQHLSLQRRGTYDTFFPMIQDLFNLGYIAVEFNQGIQKGDILERDYYSLYEYIRSFSSSISSRFLKLASNLGTLKVSLEGTEAALKNALDSIHTFHFRKITCLPKELSTEKIDRGHRELLSGACLSNLVQAAYDVTNYIVSLANDGNSRTRLDDLNYFCIETCAYRKTDLYFPVLTLLKKQLDQESDLDICTKRERILNAVKIVTNPDKYGNAAKHIAHLLKPALDEPEKLESIAQCLNTLNQNHGLHIAPLLRHLSKDFNLLNSELSLLSDRPEAHKVFDALKHGVSLPKVLAFYSHTDRMGAAAGFDRQALVDLSKTRPGAHVLKAYIESFDELLRSRQHAEMAEIAISHGEKNHLLVGDLCAVPENCPNKRELLLRILLSEDSKQRQNYSELQPRIRKLSEEKCKEALALKCKLPEEPLPVPSHPYKGVKGIHVDPFLILDRLTPELKEIANSIRLKEDTNVNRQFKWLCKQDSIDALEAYLNDYKTYAKNPTYQDIFRHINANHEVFRNVFEKAWCLGDSIGIFLTDVRNRQEFLLRLKGDPKRVASPTSTIYDSPHVSASDYGINRIIVVAVDMRSPWQKSVTETLSELGAPVTVHSDLRTNNFNYPTDASDLVVIVTCKITHSLRSFALNTAHPLLIYQHTNPRIILSEIKHHLQNAA